MALGLTTRLSKHHVPQTRSNFQVYVDELINTLYQLETAKVSPKIIRSLLDGSSRKALASLIPHDIRKEYGIFFTPSSVSRRMLSQLSGRKRPLKIFDPACGAGDLLLAAANFLPMSDTLSGTIAAWDKFLLGMDIEETFVSATKLRLALLAIHRGARIDITPDEVLLSWSALTVRDFLGFASPAEVDCVVLNPPFSFMKLEEAKKWTSGKTSQAALFLDHVLDIVPEKCEISALLPEVLRSGTRYDSWRSSVARRSMISSIESLGLFDSRTGIDVFLVSMTKARANDAPRPWARSHSGKGSSRLSAFCDVHVGSLVPYRHRKKGPLVPYIFASSLPQWSKVNLVHEKRRFSGKLFMPPFVAVRRTSSPKDAKRAIACIIGGKEPIAVENHLIVLSPHDRTLASCNKIMDFLRSEYVDKWLNRRIRCRHLTVSSLAEMPWRPEGSAP